jgi:hypothetical protein
MERLDGTGWRKSSYSGANGGNCVEVGRDSARVLVRDTKDRETGPVLVFGREAWVAFAAQVRADVR